ncbi:nitroreductase family protein [Treponema sp. TIM-1]|uniref:nitroreductase family protein n=1 Tax=Treponema sp. TIM-1 TaxID=2898417 RepID=UPI003980E6F1
MTSNIVLDAIFTRRSTRAYTNKKVDAETVALLAKAALAAPSGSNAQPVNVLIVQNVPLILELERAVVNYFVKTGDEAVVERIKSRKNKVFYDASTVFFLAVKNNAAVDVGIMAENIAIAATSLGIANVILGLPRVVFYDPDTVAYWKEKLRFPEGYEYGLAVAVGYAAEEGKPHEIDLSKVSYL